MTENGTLEWLDPATLVVNVNVRRDAKLTKRFVASIKEHGVLQPIVAYRDDAGTVNVYMGQRRTLGAIEAGRPLIPALVVDTPEKADRLAKQVIENDLRTGLDDGDRAEAFHQMALLGVSASAIARTMSDDKTVVERALKVKANSTAANALDQGMTLDQAAVIEEFADDPEAVAKLEQVATENPDNFNHAAQRLRDERREAALIAEATAEATAKKLSILDEDPGAYYYSGPAAPITTLATADGTRLTDEDADAVYIRINYDGTVFERLAVADWKARGLAKDGKAPGGGMTEEQKEERRTLIANNKAMESATVVRREWVKSLLARKTAPKGWQAFVLHSITQHSDVTGYDGAVAADLAGIKVDETKSGWGWNPLRDHVAKSTARPEVGLIALVCAGFERGIPKDAWRSASRTNADYLSQLVTWGYTPAEVEQIILDKHDPAAGAETDTADE